MWYTFSNRSRFYSNNITNLWILSASSCSKQAFTRRRRVKTKSSRIRTNVNKFVYDRSYLVRLKSQKQWIHIRCHCDVTEFWENELSPFDSQTVGNAQICRVCSLSQFSADVGFGRYHFYNIKTLQWETSTSIVSQRKQKKIWRKFLEFK